MMEKAEGPFPLFISLSSVLKKAAIATRKSFSIIKASVLFLMSTDMSATCLCMLVGRFSDGRKDLQKT